MVFLMEKSFDWRSLRDDFKYFLLILNNDNCRKKIAIAERILQISEESILDKVESFLNNAIENKLKLLFH